MRITRLVVVATLLAFAPPLIAQPSAGTAPVVLPAQPAAPAVKRPITLEDFFAIRRVAAPQISPDGKHVAYQITEVDLARNKTSTELWLTTTEVKATPKRLLADGMPGKDPQWSPDGKAILFESKGSLYVTDIDGKEPVRITQISTGASNGIWSPDGKHIAFVSSVYPEYSEKPFAESDKLNKDKDTAIAKNPVKAKTFTKLFYRHWVEYVGDKRQHIFVCDTDGKNCRDVTPGNRDAYPTSSTFSSSDNFTFSPDSKYVVFTAAPEKDEAWSTNYDLCRVSITNTSTKWETLTKENKAADSGPKFSPDGKTLAYRSQKKAGYEADQWELTLVDTDLSGAFKGAPRRPVVNFSLSINEYWWHYGSEHMELSCDRNGYTEQFFMDVSGKNPNAFPVPTGYSPDGAAASSSFTRTSAAKDRTSHVQAYLYSSMGAPPEVYVHLSHPPQGENMWRKVSRANTELLDQLDLPKADPVKIPVEDSTTMHMWVLKPPGFDPKKKWPVVYWVHGGPQSAWRDAWSYRWNPQLWAAQGYVVVMPNPRGSVGFGQQFTDEITGDWGGKCYRDLIAGLDYVEKLPYVDKDRIAAAGGSFGGYMMNWFAVNDIAKRFKCLITHCSVWNFESMWGTTDELWFDEWEHGGLPWEKPQKYAQFSPHKRAGELGKHKTPMLIIHNDLDFRCPIGQGHELFSALQRQGVPSRFVNFPDEGHWVLKPKNSEYWHKEIFAWLKKYTLPGGK